MKLIEIKAEVVGVVTKEQSAFNSDFADLAEVCQKHDLPCFYAGNINDRECLEWCRNLKPDIMFCFGWSQLLKKEILGLAPMGVIGFHPALIPRNRGRHPIIWTLALGLEETGSTFFFLDLDVDSGEIVSQEVVPVAKEDNAALLYERITETALRQIEMFVPMLASGNSKRIPQEHSKANLWRKRGPNDGNIDWRMSSEPIYNLVRALSRPYIGAHALYEDSECKIWAVRIVSSEVPKNIEPGKVLAVNQESGTFIIKCADGALEIIDHELDPLPAEGDYL